MSTKLLDATCSDAGIVTAESSVIDDALVLSQGKKASSGIALIEGNKTRYITSNVSDIKDLITAIGGIIDQIVTVLTAHDGALGATQTATITQITTLKTQLDATKELLK